MAMLSRQAVMAAKCESTAGTDASPSSTADAIICYGLEMSPLAASSSKERRSVTGGVAHQDIPRPGLYHGKATCSVFMGGSGSAGTAPAWWPLMVACGAQQDVTAATSVVYKPGSEQVLGTGSATTDRAGHCPVSVYHWGRDIAGDSSGKLAKLLGCLGSASLTLEVGKPARCSFSLEGVYQTVTVPGGSFPGSFAFTSTEQPKAMLGGVLQVWTDGVTSFAPALRSFSLDFGVGVKMRERFDVEGGYVSAAIVDLKPTWTMVLEEPTTYASTFDWWQAYEDGTALHAIVVGPVGATAGNIWTLNIPNPGIVGVTSQDGDGIRTLSIKGNCATDTYGSDDAWTLTLT